MAAAWQWKWWIAAPVAAVAWMALGRSPQPATPAGVIEDNTYTVTPAWTYIPSPYPEETVEFIVSIGGQ